MAFTSSSSFSLSFFLFLLPFFSPPSLLFLSLSLPLSSNSFFHSAAISLRNSPLFIHSLPFRSLLSFFFFFFSFSLSLSLSLNGRSILHEVMRMRVKEKVRERKKEKRREIAREEERKKLRENEHERG